MFSPSITQPLFLLGYRYIGSSLEVLFQLITMRFFSLKNTTEQNEGWALDKECKHSSQLPCRLFWNWDVQILQAMVQAVVDRPFRVTSQGLAVFTRYMRLLISSSSGKKINRLHHAKELPLKMYTNITFSIKSECAGHTVFFLSFPFIFLNLTTLFHKALDHNRIHKHQKKMTGVKESEGPCRRMEGNCYSSENTMRTVK